MVIEFKKHHKIIICALLFLSFLAVPWRLFPSRVTDSEAKLLFDELKTNVNQIDKCLIELIEEGENYRLAFEGLFFNDSRIKGQVKNFEQPIDIYRFYDTLFVKNSENDWIEAEDLNLESLSYFLRTPWETLNLFYELPEKQLFNAEQGNFLIIESKAEACTGSNKNLVGELFPHLTANGSLQLQLFLFLEEEKRLPTTILIEGFCPTQNEVIVKRSYNFEQDYYL